LPPWPVRNFSFDSGHEPRKVFCIKPHRRVSLQGSPLSRCRSHHEYLGNSRILVSQSSPNLTESFSGPEGQHNPSRWCQPPGTGCVVGLEPGGSTQPVRRFVSTLQASKSLFVPVSGASRHRLGLYQPSGLTFTFAHASRLLSGILETAPCLMRYFGTRHLP